MQALKSDLDVVEYHNDPCETPSLSQSIAKILVEKSPRHAWMAHPRLGSQPFKPTALMEFGDLVHAGVMSESRGVVIVEADSWRTKVAKDQRDQARDAGAVPVLQKDFTRLSAAVDAISFHLLQAGVSLDSEHTEVSAFWHEPYAESFMKDQQAAGRTVAPAGVQCRGRFDLYDGGEIVSDIKTSANIPRTEDKVARKILDQGWDIQAAAYVSSVEANRPDLIGRVRMRWYLCELQPPFSVVTVTASDAMMEVGRARWMRAVEAWSTCLAADEWPKDPPEPICAWPTAWQYREATGREM